MSCDVGEVMASDELCSFSKLPVTSPTSQLILQSFRRFTYVTTHSPTLLLLQLHHSWLSKPSFTSPTSQDFHLRHLASRLCSINNVDPCLYLLWSRIKVFKSQYGKGGRLSVMGVFFFFLQFPHFHPSNIFHFSFLLSSYHFIFSFINFRSLNISMQRGCSASAYHTFNSSQIEFSLSIK